MVSEELIKLVDNELERVYWSLQCPELCGDEICGWRDKGSLCYSTFWEFDGDISSNVLSLSSGVGGILEDAWCGSYDSFVAVLSVLGTWAVGKGNDIYEVFWVLLGFSKK